MPRAFPARRAVTRAASLSDLPDEIFPNLSLRLDRAWGAARDCAGMTFKTPVAIAAAVATALGGVATAAIAFPSSPSSSPAAVVAAPSASPEVRTETVHRTVHVTRHERRRHDDRTVHRSTATRDDSGHHAGADDSGHHRRGHGHGRGRGRGGHDD
jgi:hypothetical protein